MTLLHQAAQKAVEAKQREAFEHWYSEAGRWPKSVARGEDGHYLLAQANSSYEAWRAAVSALQQQEVPREPVADFDTWQQNPYTKVLMDSIKNDYMPRADAEALIRAAASPSTTRQQEVGSGLGCKFIDDCKNGTRTACMVRGCALAAAPSTPEKAGGGKGTSNDQGENRG